MQNVQKQPSRFAVAGKFFFYVAVAPLLSGLALVSLAVLAKHIGLIG